MVTKGERIHMAARVLLVESDDEIRSSIVRALRARGVGVDAYTSSHDALTAVQNGSQWSRALIDLTLPHMDGATLAQQLLQHLPSLEITFTTAGADAAVLCHAHGLGPVLWKPLGLGPLCERFGTAGRRSGVIHRAVIAPKTSSSSS
jgi:CheY-like chemotaxis protein